MRVLVDVICSSCHEEVIDFYAVLGALGRCECGGDYIRMWKAGSTAKVIGDDIPGGVEVRNGICNEDGSPRRYYSKTEMKREAEARGLVNHVEHIPDKGSDKNAHTQRWV